MSCLQQLAVDAILHITSCKDWYSYALNFSEMNPQKVNIVLAFSQGRILLETFFAIKSAGLYPNKLNVPFTALCGKLVIPA